MRRIFALTLLVSLAGCTGQAVETTILPPAQSTTVATTTTTSTTTTTPIATTTTLPPTTTTSTTTSTLPVEEQIPCGLPPELCRTGTLVQMAVAEGIELPFVVFTVPVGTPLIAPVDGDLEIYPEIEFVYESGVSGLEILLFPRTGMEGVEQSNAILVFYVNELIGELDSPRGVTAGEVLGTVAGGQITSGYNLLMGVGFLLGPEFTMEDAIRETPAVLEAIFHVGS